MASAFFLSPKISAFHGTARRCRVYVNRLRSCLERLWAPGAVCAWPSGGRGTNFRLRSRRVRITETRIFRSRSDRILPREFRFPRISIPGARIHRLNSPRSADVRRVNCDKITVTGLAAGTATSRARNTRSAGRFA